jgi:hypothetical protein
LSDRRPEMKIFFLRASRSVPLRFSGRLDLLALGTELRALPSRIESEVRRSEPTAA